VSVFVVSFCRLFSSHSLCVQPGIGQSCCRAEERRRRGRSHQAQAQGEPFVSRHRRSCCLLRPSISCPPDSALVTAVRASPLSHCITGPPCRSGRYPGDLGSNLCLLLCHQHRHPAPRPPLPQLCMAHGTRTVTDAETSWILADIKARASLASAFHPALYWSQRFAGAGDEELQSIRCACRREAAGRKGGKRRLRQPRVQAGGEGRQNAVQRRVPQHHCPRRHRLRLHIHLHNLSLPPPEPFSDSLRSLRRDSQHQGGRPLRLHSRQVRL
jgi:hypothetical protein